MRIIGLILGLALVFLVMGGSVFLALFDDDVEAYYSQRNCVAAPRNQPPC
jgi:hypothetical protein